MQDYNNYTYIKTCSATGVTTSVSAEPCVLKAIIINVSSLYTVGLVDNTTGTTVNVGKIYKSATTGSYLYNCEMNAGLRIVTTGAATIIPDITVITRR
jgi:hypothetical protein